MYSISLPSGSQGTLHRYRDTDRELHVARNEITSTTNTVGSGKSGSVGGCTRKGDEKHRNKERITQFRSGKDRESQKKELASNSIAEHACKISDNAHFYVELATCIAFIVNNGRPFLHVEQRTENLQVN